ncbi:hypothetical protein ABMA28_002544 [Loxostege sticticalis]|uniref:Uncharacterized protein n=1 Tax=Loxostege sticticalis TaxID=481309 RepID=A0ABD0SX67_LOXSC
MDDYVSSVACVEKAASLARDIVDLHKLAHFEMRGWISNHPEALKLLPDDLLAAPHTPEVPVLAPPTNVRTLGLFWNASKDYLNFHPELPEEVPSTLSKRMALSYVMRLFDPLGFLSPITIHGRILLQVAWASKIDWDEPLPRDQIKLWQKWFKNTNEIQNLQIPRWHLFSDFAPIEQELHVFADASESAYACVIYWRFTDAHGQIHISFIASKARVAPNSPVSIARLELQAGLMAVRLAATVISEHNLKPSRRCFWTDSMNVLGWLRTEGRCLKTFVANRVGEISEGTKLEEWRWVPSELNVADDATRAGKGISSRWLHGPSFLHSTPDTWPSETSSTLSDECLQEFKTPVTTDR